jgi:hypothetical protein
MSLDAPVALLPTIFIALRPTFLRRAPQQDDQKIMLYPGDAVAAAHHETAGDYIRLSGAEMRDGPLPPGDWYIFAAKWHQERPQALHPFAIPETTRELMYHFLTLGEDCEFSFMQRRIGAEPIEMLRFAGMPIAQLINGFEDEFCAIGAPEHIGIEIFPNGEIWCVNRKYSFRQHVFKNPSALERDAFKKQQSLRLNFLRRKFFEDIAAGDKILVYKRRDGVAQEQVVKLNQAVRKRGAAPVLWVTKCREGQAPGTVEPIGDGLYKAYLTKFAPDGKAALGDMEEWIRICETAKALLLPDLT